MNEIKTPVGLVPKRVWVAQRISEIKCAICRYMDSDMGIPVEWINEYNELIKQS